MRETLAVAGGDRGDELLSFVCVTVDEANRSGWFWYWTTLRARGRGLTRRAAATVGQWALTERDKFLVDGRRIDVDTYGRLRTDPSQVDALPMIQGG
ncbi:hypothetical protein ACIGH6_15890 [Brachybacterium paraconglomeratum]|uniref:hypothetical protein n=1 Tax=Brachybacterium paraconglomeratum TaxID=173362 RepID=UPI0037C63878